MSRHLLQARSFLTFRQTMEYRFTPKFVRDLIITYSQIHRTDKYCQHSSIIWPVWLNGLVFHYELSSCGFESRCCHLKSQHPPSPPHKKNKIKIKIKIQKHFLIPKQKLKIQSEIGDEVNIGDCHTV